MPSDKNIKFATLAVFPMMVLVAVLPVRLDRSTTALVRELRAELDQQQRLERVLDGLRDAESAQRGFVITGNAVLRAIAQLVRQSIRDCAVACRYGGEELVILMPDCSQPDAARRAEALRADIAGPEAITASFGVAEYPIHGPDAEALFRAADRALYQAKREGRNRMVTALAP